MKATRWHGDGDVRVDASRSQPSSTTPMPWSASRSRAFAAQTCTDSTPDPRSARLKACGSATNSSGSSKRWAGP